MGETRRKFDKDFREGAVRLVRETGKPIAQVARDLGINPGTLGNWVDADRRERDALAADVATAVEADLFITERPYLFGTKRIHVPAVTLCQTPEALAMIGLYLRSQGEFILWRRLSAFTQFPRVPSFDAQVTGHLRDRLAGLPDQPDRALPEVRIELPACLCHRRPP